MTTAWRWAGLLARIPAAYAVATVAPDSLGLGVALAAPTFATCVLAGVLIGELAAPAQQPAPPASRRWRSAPHAPSCPAP